MKIFQIFCVGNYSLLILFLSGCSGTKGITKMDGSEEFTKIKKEQSIIIGTLRYNGGYMNDHALSSVSIENNTTGKNYLFTFNNVSTINLQKILDPGKYGVHISLDIKVCTMNVKWSISTGPNGEAQFDKKNYYDKPVMNYLEFEIKDGSLIDLGVINIDVDTETMHTSPYWPPPTSCKLYLNQDPGNALEKFSIQYPTTYSDFESHIIQLLKK